MQAKTTHAAIAETRMNVLRVRSAISPRIFRTRGGLFFAPQDDRYQATRCKPAVSTWLKGKNPLRRIADGCHKHDLALRVVLTCSMAGRTAARFPQAAAKTVFGDPWPDRLCLVNPDVQSLLIALCRDLTDNYDPTTIELAEMHPGRIAAAGDAPQTSLDLGPGGQSLLRTCFCESCRQLDRPGTNVDVAAAARSAETRLRRVLETGRPIDQPLHSALADDPSLSEYIRAQWRALAEMAANVRAETGREIVVHAYDDIVAADHDPYPPGGSAAPPAADAILTTVHHVPDNDLESIARAALTRGGATGRAELQVSAFHEDGATSTAPDASALVRMLPRLAALGLASVNLDNYGQIPEAGLDVVRQAVRFARRVPPGGPRPDRA